MSGIVMARVQLECFVAPPHQDPCHVQASISYLRVGHLKSKAKGYTSVSCGCSVAVRCCSSTPLPMISSLPSQPSPWLTSPSSAAWAVERFQGIWTAKVSASFCAAMALVMTYAQALSALVLRLLEKAQLNLQNLCSKNRTLGLCRGGDVLMADNLRGLKDGLLEQGGLGMALLSTTAMAKDHISPVLATLCANPTFMSGLVAWAVAQVLKVFTTFFVERRWDFKMLLGSGGMPSSHSALCVALTTSVAICHGISDALFPVCLGFSLIVMYDATGVRRHAGMQAEVLNLIVEDLFQGHPISEKKLKELLGHTPLQVGGGAILGMVVGYLCSQGYSAFSTGHGF